MPFSLKVSVIVEVIDEPFPTLFALGATKSCPILPRSFEHSPA